MATRISDESTTSPAKGPQGSATKDGSAKKERLTHRLYTGHFSYDFIGRRKRWYIISVVLIAISLLAVAVRGLNLGIEFLGGAEFQANAQVNSRTVDDVRAAVERTNLPDAGDVTVTTLGDHTVRVQTRTLNAETEVPKVRQAIGQQVGVPADQVAYSLIGASWGKQITQQGLIALVVFLVAVMAMIWIYFRNLFMSLAAILALMHDLIVTVGIYALAGFTFTPATLIGLLTILGYSLYDTVVVFDKVRENTRDLTKTRFTYAERANLAVNQVLVRSINTTLIGVLPVAALLVAGWFILGTGPLRDLGLALFIGMIAGAYSSLFIATPLLVDMNRRSASMREHEKKLARRENRRGNRHDNAALAEAEARVNRLGEGEAYEVGDGDSFELAEDEPLEDPDVTRPRSKAMPNDHRTSRTRPQPKITTVRTNAADPDRTQPRNTTRSQRKK